MNKFPIVSLLLFVVFFIAAVVLSVSQGYLPQERSAIVKQPEQLKIVYTPVAGLDKFYADAQFVALVQQMADYGVSKKANQTEEQEKSERAERAKYFVEQFEKLSDLDPNNEKYYKTASLFISNDQPEEAIKLLQKGDKLLKNASWEYPFYQYHIINNIISMNDDQKKKANIDKMVALLGEAMKRSGAPEHVQNKWLRLLAEKEGFTDDSVGRLKIWRNYYKSRVRADRSLFGAENGADAANENSDDLSDGGYSYAPDSYNSILTQIMSMAQNLAVENFKERQKAKGDDLKKLEAEHKEISEIFFSVAPAGHYSKVSLRPYDAGDLFDVYTGTAVEPYGVDPEMLEKGVVVIYKGDFSQATGKPRVPDKIATNGK